MVALSVTAPPRGNPNPEVTFGYSTKIGDAPVPFTSKKGALVYSRPNRGRQLVRTIKGARSRQASFMLQKSPKALPYQSERLF